jgi:hypothetical protein
VAVDIDSSGTLEVFVTGNSVYAWHADGTPVISGNSDGMFFEPTGSISQGRIGRFYSTPAIGDLDLDGDFEIVVAAWDDNIYVLDEQGNVKWQRYVEPKWSSPSLGDIDGDGDLEVFIGSDRDTLYAWDCDGSAVNSSFPTGAFVALPDGATVNYGSPAIADIDTVSGTVEVIYATRGGNVYAWDKDATLLWSYATGLERAMSSPIIGDVDDDGTLEVVVAEGLDAVATKNRLYVLNATTGGLEKYWSGADSIPGSISTVGSGWIHPPSLADLDGDDDLEIMIGTEGPSLGYNGDTRAVVYDHFRLRNSCLDAIPVPGVNLASSSHGYVNSAVTVADLDFDTDPELLAGSSTFGLFMWNWDEGDTCSAEPGWPITLFGEVDATPFVGDVDGDGLFEIIAKGLDGQVHLFDLGATYSSSKVEWGQYGHDSHNTFRYDSGVDAVGGPPSGGTLSLDQNFPNPFNPVTTIRYEVDDRAVVRLKVYDVTGRMVRSLVDGRHDPGAYEVLWDGRNHAGVELATGVYFCRFKVGDYVDTMKMLLIK